MGYPGLGVAKERGHGGLVKLDFSPVSHGNLYGLHVSDGDRLRYAPDVGQGPVIPIVGNTQLNFLRGDLGHRVFYHLAHLV